MTGKELLKRVKGAGAQLGWNLSQTIAQLLTVGMRMYGTPVETEF